ncbi:DUF2853 family protein [Ponticaulis sp.]|uniref:DUF2853 family protein n=1 Tax=Ponticaulis sp. TaxID=2020902 RepID=UPI000B6B993C|nr:DUF2853 family protein [Ponticaulis sp.]MAI90994.1 hypothetical protein [Ponticaulis sp.]OUX98335.1 MAG: hypothetical protein CBB65_11155 [Hyphomonadaceae bacterium TMED5]|tara:strand:- start:144486 stop:144812 length:327 start_codon:yes stop_codon:yes gene_type:complete
MADIAPYVDNVKKYASNYDEATLQKIVNHLGIALQSRDASLVSCSDPSELERVKEKWLKKKFELTDSDADLDAAIEEVCTTMKDEKSNKSRVTFYYLLAEKYGKVGAL